MEIRQGYKQTEIGVIPKDWEAKFVRDIATSISSGTSDTLNENGVYPLYGSTGTIGQKHKFDYSGEKILVARVGANAGTVNKVSGQYCVSDNTLIVDFTKDVDINFFYYQLIKKNLNSLVFGSGQPLLTGGQLKDLRLPTPCDPGEQNAIAGALSDADGLISSLDHLIAKKRRIKQGAMQDLLRPKEDWVEKKLGEIAEIKTGERNNQDKVEDGKYPLFVRSATIEKINSFSYDCEAILVPGEGGIGSIFHYINGRFDVHQRVYAISMFQKNVSGKFIYYLMVENFGHHAMQNSVKATVDSLRLPTFQVFAMSVPPTIEEQTAIAAILSDMDVEITALEQKLSKTRQLKQGMMAELLTGRIRLV